MHSIFERTPHLAAVGILYSFSSVMMMDSVDDFVDAYRGLMQASYASSMDQEAQALSRPVLEMGHEIAGYLESKGAKGVRSEIEGAVEHILTGRPNLIQSGGMVLGNWAELYKASNP